MGRRMGVGGGRGGGGGGLKHPEIRIDLDVVLLQSSRRIILFVSPLADLLKLDSAVTEIQALPEGTAAAP